MPEIVFLMGKSATGKDHIYERLIEELQPDFKRITMYTTRPMREGEVQGLEYYFVDEETAGRLEREGKIVEMRCYSTVSGVWRYFTVNDGQIDFSGKNRYIVIGTLEAYEKFCKYYGKGHFLPIYIETEDEIRLLRAINREKKQKNPKYAEVCRRFLADERDFSEEKLKKAGIVFRIKNNETLDECVEKVRNVILTEINAGNN